MITLQAAALRIEIGPDGRLLSLRTDDTERLPPGRQPFMLTASFAGVPASPERAAFSPDTGRLTLGYGNGTEVDVAVAVRPTHLALRVVDARGPRPTALLWGPYPTTVADVVGETVGVVQGDGVAIGLQTLNPETVGGWPEAHTGLGCPDEAGAAGARYDYRECTAWRTVWGSVLQAYSRDPAGDAPEVPARLAAVRGRGPEGAAPAVPLHDLTGSAIALFACPAERALEVIGAIELAEGLPHPLLQGQWAKTSPDATAAYLIADFSEETLDRALGYAESAGLRYLYHPDPFVSWGHYELRPAAFPEGDRSLRRCVERSGARGIALGVHTLSNFLNPHDPHVSPRPDPRLQRTGAARLTEDLSETEEALPVADPGPFREQGWLSAVSVDGELIRYASVSDTAPWRLLGCERGAFGTPAAMHPAGTAVAKLADHGYRVFFPDIALQDVVADRLSALFQHTGLRQISFDGLEGCLETGYGPYAEARFVTRAAAGWPDGVINDASRLGHFAWHLHTRMNWGEPWGAAMREGQTEYRFRNQEYFARNLFPRMLGWFLMRSASEEDEATTLDDIEWMLSRAASFDAGFALVAGLSTLERNGLTPAILEAVRQWESARHAGAFSPEQRQRLKADGAEWHLEPDPEAPLTWNLTPLSVSRAFACRPGALQPGQPGGADWQVENLHRPQPLCFRLRVRTAAGTAGRLCDPTFSAGGTVFGFRCRLAPGEYLVYEGGRAAAVCDANWNRLREVPAVGETIGLRTGMQPLSFTCGYEGDSRPAAEVRFLTRGEPERVRRAVDAPPPAGPGMATH